MTKKPKSHDSKTADPMVEATNTQAEQSVAPPVSIPTESPKIDDIGRKPSHPMVSVGVWAYVIGLLVAVAASFFVDSAIIYYSYTVLAILGFIVGLLNITDEEVLLFLVACIAFIVSASSVKTILVEWPTVTQALANVIVFTGASAFIISLKAIIRVSRDE